MAATDIRAGAGLVLAGLLSDGVTEVQDIDHVDRGYPDFVDQLRGLGAEIKRTSRAGEASAGDVDASAARVGVLGEDQDVGAIGAGNGPSSGSRRRRAPPGARTPTPGGTAWRSG